ncbi:MAG: hypothetical protein IKV69_00080, partial [Clostridia bacterium]|nr:hypothetical protein [Clostridia bacterium]
MKDTNLRIKDAEIEISKLAKTIRQTTDALGGMGADIAEIEEKNSTIEAGLAQTNTDLAGIKETASQQAAELVNLQTTTTQHAAHITTLQNGTVGLANRVSAVEKTATENSSKIAQNSAQITQNTQGLEAHAETLTDFDTSIKFLSNTSSNLLQRVAYLEENAGESSAVLEPRLAEVERKQAEAQIEINALNRVLGETKTTVESLETQVEANTQAIEELKAGGTGAADTTALEQQIAQNATNIEALQATVTTLQTATQVNATNIAENSAKIGGIQENYRVVA